MKLPLRFVLDEEARKRISLSAGLRAPVGENRVKLRESSTSGFPTAAGEQGSTWLANPTSARELLAFGTRSDQPEGTEIVYRLFDGDDDWFWDEDLEMWREPVVGEWNTEQQVNEGLPSFALEKTTIAVRFMLSTTNRRLTPVLYELAFVYEADVVLNEAYTRAILQRLKSVRGSSEYRAVAVGGSTLPFPILSSAATDEASPRAVYPAVSIDGAWNLTTDPGRRTNLFQSYNSTTKVIQLSSSPVAGSVLSVRFSYTPVVAQTTSQDYEEVETVPCVYLDRIAPRNSKRLSRQNVTSRAGVGYFWEDVRQVDYELSLMLMADKALDLLKLAEACRLDLRTNPFLHVPELDMSFAFVLSGEYETTSVPTQKEVHTGRMNVDLRCALLFNVDATLAPTIDRVLFNTERR